MRGSLMKVVFVLVAVVLVGSCGVGCASYFVRNEYEATVTDKQVKRQEKKDTYLIFTKLRDGSVRVFKNTDSTLYWKFNSSDVFAKLEKGQTYRIKAYGWRIPFFSMYENIVSATEVR